MNEQQFALQVRRVLDESAEHLPYRVSHRLEAARQAALAAMPRVQALALEKAAGSVAGAPVGVAPVPVLPGVSAQGAASAATLSAGTGFPTPTAATRGARSLWLRAGIALLPLVLVALGLLGISIWHELDVADETADVDLAVLTDDVPISAYADRGFGVFLKNSQQ
jgi:hypothetical protein